MGLDVRVLRMLDRFAVQDVEHNVKDAQALDYINGLPDMPSQRYLRSEYVRYYFKAKAEYKKEQDPKGYGHGV